MAATFAPSAAPAAVDQPESHRANLSRSYLAEFIRRAAASVPPGGRILDAGAGDCRYRVLFRDCEYESADFCQVDKPYADVTYVCDLKDIPVEDARYDTVLLSQVLEHLPDPSAVLKELARVSKPGARLWLSTPFYYQEHETPYDFFRYTQYGLRRLAADAGFDVVEIGWLEGYHATFAHQLRFARRNLPKHARAYGGGVPGHLAAAAVTVARPLLGFAAKFMEWCERRHKWTESGHCKNYCVVARRAAAAEGG